uniref:Uncharacterized protein n=1 Tax=Arundo donax TaxID=35708 RepID=A0A0A8XMX9_ARUDO
MEPEGDGEDDVHCWAENNRRMNLGLDFFRQPPSNFSPANSSSGVLPRRRSAGVGLDLNSQAGDMDDGMSYMDLLRSSSPAVFGEEESAGDGGGTGGGRRAKAARVTALTAAPRSPAPATARAAPSTAARAAPSTAARGTW